MHFILEKCIHEINKNFEFKKKFQIPHKIDTILVLYYDIHVNITKIQNFNHIYTQVILNGKI